MNVLDDDGTALQKILQMSICIFILLSTECDSLQHLDEAWLELVVMISNVKGWSNTNILGAGSREFT